MSAGVQKEISAEFKRRQIKGSNFQGFQASYFAVEVAVVPAQNWRSG
jgi:hypothetical protein